MKKIVLTATMVFACASCFGFRVTKDLGYGIKTYENSKTNVRGVSFDNGNTWYKVKDSETTVTTNDSTDSEYDEEESEFKKSMEKAEEDALNSGKVFRIVGQGMAYEVTGKRVNIAEKTKTLTMKNEDGERYIAVDYSHWKFIKACIKNAYGDGWDSGHAFMSKGKMIVKYYDGVCWGGTKFVSMRGKLILPLVVYSGCIAVGEKFSKN